MAATSYKIKDLHEEGTCRRFLEVYNNAYGASVSLQLLQAPPKPDCQCSDGIEIELTSVYYDNEAAKESWGVARGSSATPTAPRWVLEPDETIFNQIDKAILQKYGKSYDVKGRLWLVIWIDAPLLTHEDLTQGYLKTPRGLGSGQFEMIWLLVSDDKGFHIDRVVTDEGCSA